MEIDHPIGATPHDAPVCNAVPSDWIDTGLTICRRCEHVTDIGTLEAHNHVHDVADARLRGETLTTPTRMTVATNQQAGVKKGTWE